MRQNTFLLLLCLSFSTHSIAQSANADSSLLILINQQIDDAVVRQDITALDSLYASDFVFSHGSGNVQDKKAWLATVGRTKYPLRRHDSVKVELHGGVALVKGKMWIERIDKTKTEKYYLRYIRLYALKNKQWQLISHNTTQEVHEQ